MRYDPEKHRRRSVRLPCYDYSQSGVYFATICADKRRSMFRDLSIRDAILWAWESMPEHFNDVLLDEFVVMPNHVHGMLLISRRGEACLAPTLGTVISSFKSAATKCVNKMRRTPGKSIWQRNYFERVVRNERELHAIRQYIQYNPIMWDTDCENPERSAAVPSSTIRDEIEAVLKGTNPENRLHASGDG